MTYERIVELNDDATEDGALNTTPSGVVRKYLSKHMITEEGLRYCFRRLALMTPAGQSLHRLGARIDIPTGLRREKITTFAGCGYAEVRYKCSHRRYTVRRWCKAEPHKRCPVEIVAM